MLKRFKFTTAKLMQLPVHDADSRSSECEYSDISDITGFKILVGKSGKKKFLLRYSINGKKCSKALGVFPEVSLIDARSAARQIKSTIAEGKDPVDIIEKNEIPTVKAFFESNYLPIAKTRKKTWRHDIARFRLCRSLHDIPYDELRVSHIQSMIAELMDTVHWQGRKYSKSTLNRILCVLKASGRQAELEYGIPSVAHKVKQFAVHNARTRWCTISEIQAIFAECRKPQYCQIRSRFIILLFMLGCRDKSLRAAKWENIDLVNRVMRIPSSLSKNGSEHLIYLTSDAVVEFEALKEFRKINNPYVFVGTKPVTYIGPPRWMFEQIKRRTGLKDSDLIVFHTARHSFAANLISAGVDVGVLKQLMGHRTINSTMRYAKISESHQRKSSEILTEMIRTN